MRLAARQRQLVAALTMRSTIPPGFESSDLYVAARALSRKRARSVAKTWPKLAASLGVGFAQHFAAYARHIPLPEQGGSIADGRAFCEYLSTMAKLTDAGRIERLLVDLRYRHSRQGLRLRRLPSIRWIRLQDRSAVALGFSLPGRGGRCAIFTLRTGR